MIPLSNVDLMIECNDMCMTEVQKNPGRYYDYENQISHFSSFVNTGTWSCTHSMHPAGFNNRHDKNRCGNDESCSDDQGPDSNDQSKVTSAFSPHLMLIKTTAA